ncbi:hypothetical protein AA0472_2286 [Acetobacter estunensis NRIC 0472]|nr:hypothetical protein AA0472_2286 [Acetobacter estunensis NRIC 0472]
MVDVSGLPVAVSGEAALLDKEDAEIAAIPLDEMFIAVDVEIFAEVSGKILPPASGCDKEEIALETVMFEELMVVAEDASSALCVSELTGKEEAAV